MPAGVVMVTLAAASWGTWSLFLRPSGLPVTVTTPLVFAVMGLFALPLALRAPAVVWTRRAVVLIVLNALFDALNILTFFAAIDVTTVAIAVLAHYAAPIIIAVAAPRIDGVVTPGARPAAVVALVGLAIVLSPWRGDLDERALIGAGLGLASAVCYAGNTFTVKRIAESIGAERGMSYHSLLAAVLTVPLLVAAPHDSVTPRGVAFVTAGAITIGAISGIVFARGLVKIGSAPAAVLAFAEPLVAVAIGALVWAEPLGVSALLGAGLILSAGIYVATRPRHVVVPDRLDRDALV